MDTVVDLRMGMDNLTLMQGLVEHDSVHQDGGLWTVEAKIVDVRIEESGRPNKHWLAVLAEVDRHVGDGGAMA